MKAIVLLLTLFAFAACANTPSTVRQNRRTDALYFQNTEEGRRAAHEVSELYGEKQEVLIVDQKLPPMRPPVPVFQPLPQYPAALNEAGVSGTVTVDFIIDEEGSVFAAVVVESTNPGFNAAALEAVRRAKFRPAQSDGQNIRVRMRVPITFSIQP